MLTLTEIQRTYHCTIKWPWNEGKSI